MASVRCSLASLSILAGLMLAPGCGGADHGTGPTFVDVRVTSPLHDTLYVAGDTVTFKADALSSRGDTIGGRPFSWSSSAPGVASIDAASGRATAVSAGTTMISATSDSHGSNPVPLVVNFSSHIVQGTVSLAPAGLIPALRQRRVAVSGRSVAMQRFAVPAAVGGFAAGLFPMRAVSGGVVGPAPSPGGPSVVPGEWVVTFRSQALSLPALGSPAYAARSTSIQVISAIRSSLAATVSTGHATVVGISPTCGIALNEDTILELLDSTGTEIALNDDIDPGHFNLCSRITMTLAPGTYYLRVSAYPGASKVIAGASTPPGIPGRRYTVSARAGS
jgi:hypothetical protein